MPDEPENTISEPDEQPAPIAAPAGPRRKSQRKAKKPDALGSVVNWILAGHGEADIVEAINAEFPRAKSRPLIIAAMNKLAKAGDVDPDVILGFVMEGTREIYRRAVEIGDHQTALRALKQLRDLSKSE